MGYSDLDKAHLVREREELRQLLDKNKVEHARLTAAYEAVDKALNE